MNAQRPAPVSSWVSRAFVLAVALVTSGCASAGSGPPEPVTSPTGYTYPIGTPPTGTLFSQTANLYIRQGSLERAYELALDGIEDNPENPVHYFVAGRALASCQLVTIRWLSAPSGSTGTAGGLAQLS